MFLWQSRPSLLENQLLLEGRDERFGSFADHDLLGKRCTPEVHASPRTCPKPLSKATQNSNSFKHIGQDSSFTTLFEWMERNDPHFSQCQRVPFNSGVGAGRLVPPVMNIKALLAITTGAMVGEVIGAGNCQI